MSRKKNPESTTEYYSSRKKEGNSDIHFNMDTTREASHKRTNATGFQFCEVPRLVILIETGNVAVKG